jgi:hypothetical protein
MTGQLRSTLENRADQLDTWDVDLDAVLRRGDRRVRRRRAAVAGGLAGVLVVAGGLAAFAGHGHRTGPPPADQDAKPLAYAVGSVIHTGSDTIDVGKKVVSFVPTHWGFVFSTPDRRLYREQDGQVRPITTFDNHPSFLGGPTTPLTVSDDGLVVAWWDGQRIQAWPGYRRGMHDALYKTNEFPVVRPRSSDDVPRVEALSHGHMWFWDGQRPWIAEVRPLTSTAGWPDKNAPGSGTVVDAAGDHVLVSLREGMAVTKANLRPLAAGEQDGWKPGGDLTGLTPQVTRTSEGDLAPDGKHWFTASGDGRDTFEVYDSATGHAQTPRYSGGHVTPYAWLDDDTIAAWTQTSSVPAYNPSPVSLLRCHVSTGTCEVAARDIGSFGSIAIDGLPIR